MLWHSAFILLVMTGLQFQIWSLFVHDTLQYMVSTERSKMLIAGLRYASPGGNIWYRYLVRLAVDDTTPGILMM